MRCSRDFAHNTLKAAGFATCLACGMNLQRIAFTSDAIQEDDVEPLVVWAEATNAKFNPTKAIKL